MGKKVELLVPAKNFMAIKASGPYADAVYFGVDKLNMRMNSDNFPVSALPEIVERLHNPKNPNFRKRKAYLTTNVLVYDQELSELEDIFQEAKDAGVDAVIVHDVGAIMLAKKVGIPFHISTQSSISNIGAARFYESMGSERLILARECSLRQIKRITTALKTAEIETFVHGAMCSSVSGRCYLSQTIAGTADRSANRGLCTQPCRQKWSLLRGPNNSEFIYDGERIFNSRDLCMIAYIPDLIQAGIISLKIEGRMRHPHYVETVSRVYREAIDSYYNRSYKKDIKTKGWLSQLKSIYNRGFTTGFFFDKATEKDSSLKSPANLSHFRYMEMGTVLFYNTSQKQAKISLFNGTLTTGDELIVMSKDPQYDTYFSYKVDGIYIKGKKVHKTPQGRKEKMVEIMIDVPKEVNSNEIDAIYKFTDETYKTKAYILK